MSSSSLGRVRSPKKEDGVSWGVMCALLVEVLLLEGNTGSGEEAFSPVMTPCEHMVKAFPCVFMNVIMCVKLLKLVTCSHMITQLCVYTCSTVFPFNSTSQTLS